jgi:peptide/nickel transport system ATP-binding protein
VPELLAVEDLRLSLPTARGRVDALRGVSFTLGRGQTLGLIGESGSGKSLTALSLLGLLPEGARLAGSIRLAGEELVGASDERLCRLRGSRIGMVFQEPMSALNPLMTVGAQIVEAMRQHRPLSRAVAWEEAFRLLERVQMSQARERLHAWPHQLSGGQRQRVVIAMALANSPELLIADEPTTALDVTLQREVLDLIQRLVHEGGMGLLLISHDLGVMADRVRRLAVMYGGRIVEQGPTPAVFSRLAHPYTQGLFGARPVLAPRQAGRRRARLPTIPGRVPELADLPAGCAFADRCALAIEACRAAPPPPVPVGAGHTASCIRVQPVAA